MREAADQRSGRPSRATALAVAHNDLLRRCHTADCAGDWQESVILSALADVADYLKRIGDNPESAHYRAEKAGALLTAAIRLHRDTLLANGGWPEDDRNEHAVLTASRQLEEVTEHVQRTMWHAMRGARADSPVAGTSPADDLDRCAYADTTNEDGRR